MVGATAVAAQLWAPLKMLSGTLFWWFLKKISTSWHIPRPNGFHKKVS